MFDEDVLKSFAPSDDELDALNRLLERGSMWWPQNNKLSALCEQLNAFKNECGF
jgi:hypothetical protein